jgi:hypothetical protein
MLLKHILIHILRHFNLIFLQKIILFMKTRTTLLLLLFCVCFTAKAQTLDSLAHYRHSLGIITSPALAKLFSSNRELPIGLIYRLKLRSDANLRISFLASHDNENFTSSGTNYKANWSNSYFQITSGFEWQQILSGRWILYYGIEGGALADITKSDSPVNFPNDKIQYTRKTFDKSIGILLRPLAGLNFKLNDKIYIGTETAILVRSQRREINTDIFASSGETESIEKSNGIWKTNKIKYQPLSNILISLHF